MKLNKKLIKNTFIGLLLLSFAATAVSMEQPAAAIPIQTEPSSVEEMRRELDEKIAKIYEKEREAADAKDEWASLSWWTKGLNIFSTVSASYRLLRNLFAPKAYEKKGFLTIGQFIQNGLPDIVTTINRVQQAMPISPDTYIEIDKSLVMPGAARHNLIRFNPSLLMLFDEEERASIVAHESRHLHNKDLIYEELWRMASPLVTYGILKVYSKGTRYLLTALQKKFEKNSRTYRFLRTLKTINTAVSHNVITHVALQIFLDRKFENFIELRADRESALLLNNVEAAISALNKLKDGNFLKNCATVLGQQSSDFITNFAENDAGSPYPIDVRLKALEALKSKIK